MRIRSSGLAVAAVCAGLVPFASGMALAAGEAGAKGAFPPFDSTTFASQVFWLAIAFGVLYWLMSRVALPRIGTILAERSATIGRDLDDAAAKQAKARETADAYEKALAEARKNAQGIAQAARDAGTKASDERRKAVEAELAAKLDQAEQTIAGTKASAMSNVRSLGSEVASAIVGKLTGSEPAAADVSAAVDRVLAKG